jgi:hypothetical protein
LVSSGKYLMKMRQRPSPDRICRTVEETRSRSSTSPPMYGRIDFLDGRPAAEMHQ